MSTNQMLKWSIPILLMAALLRLAAFGDVPPGLYHDEAYHGLDVVDVLNGNPALYFPANNGREPLFIYLATLTVGALGRSPFALRLAAFPVGMLTIAASIAMGRVLFSHRVGLLTGAVLAVTLWHVHLSRVAFRAVLLPLFIALTAWQVAVGCRRGTQSPAGRRAWLAAGALYGLSFYTYSAVRFTPIALVVLVIYAMAIRHWPRRLWAGLARAGLAAALVLTPLAVYTLIHPDIVLGRLSQVSITDPAINNGDFWGTLLTHTLRTAGMFFLRGDRIWRHNVPWRPIFDPLLGAAFIVGVGVALRRARRQSAAGFVLLWVAVMSGPTLLAEDAPHFLRAVGILPVVALLPALGMEWIGQTIAKRWGRPVARIVLGVALLVGLGSTVNSYFGWYAHQPMTAYWFEQGAAQLGGRINRFLKSGWDGEQMQSSRSETSDREVYLDPLLWNTWQPQLRFLIPEAERRAHVATIWPHQPASAPPAAVFAWPYGDWKRAWHLLPSPAEITVEEGPLSQGDRDPEPFITYLAFLAEPPPPVGPTRAHFSGGVILQSVEVTSMEEAEANPDTTRLRIRLRWQVTAPLTEDYTVFLHYLRDGERIAQDDHPPAGGRYPTSLWQPGDIINDDHWIAGIGLPDPARDRLLLGFWQPESDERLYLLDEAGNPAGDWIEVSIGELGE